MGKSDAEREELRQELLATLRGGDIKVDNAETLGFAMSLEAAVNTGVGIFSSEWTVIASDAPTFVTSDTGLSMFDATPRAPWSGNGWLSSPKAETVIPLSAHTALRVRPGAPFTRYDRVDTELVDVLNARTYGWAERYIYGANQAVVQHVRQVAKKRPHLVVRPRPQLQVILVDVEPGDTALADDHRRRGWPPYLGVRNERGDVEPHDYMVVGPSGDAVEVGVHTTHLAKRRALGKAEDVEPVD